MQQFSRIVLVGLGLGLAAVVLSSLPSHPVAAANGGPSVTVVGSTPAAGDRHSQWQREHQRHALGERIG
jgi:hypothetical protein